VFNLAGSVRALLHIIREAVVRSRLMLVHAVVIKAVPRTTPQARRPLCSVSAFLVLMRAVDLGKLTQPPKSQRQCTCSDDDDARASHQHRHVHQPATPACFAPTSLCMAHGGGVRNPHVPPPGSRIVSRTSCEMDEGVRLRMAQDIVRKPPAPSIVAVDTGDERSHGLIRRAGLQLEVGALALLALAALKLIRRCLHSPTCVSSHVRTAVPRGIACCYSSQSAVTFGRHSGASGNAWTVRRGGHVRATRRAGQGPSATCTVGVRGCAPVPSALARTPT